MLFTSNAGGQLCLSAIVRCMRASGRLRFLAPLLLGVAVGIFLADAGWWRKNNGLLWWISGVPMLYPILYYPSGMLFHACVFLHIAPSGNAAWSLYPWCIIALWTVIGLLVGLWLRRRQARAAQGAQHSATGFDAASVAKQVARVRQDYVAALHSRPHPACHRAGLIAQARQVLAHLPYFRHKLTEPTPAEDHDERTHIP